jgi:hypothetical protein
MQAMRNQVNHSNNSQSNNNESLGQALLQQMDVQAEEEKVEVPNAPKLPA